MRALVELCCLLTFAAIVAANTSNGSTAEVRGVSVGVSGESVTIDVSLTGAVIPEVIVATGPDRLVLQLPNTSAPKHQQAVTLNRNGVKGVRVGLNRAVPPVARIVVDLQTAHPYAIAMKGTKITLTVLPVPVADWPTQLHGAPSSSGPMVPQLTHRPPKEGPSASSNTRAANPVPRQPSGGSLRTAFMIKCVAEGVAYLNGGRSSGLASGMILAVRYPRTPTGSGASDLRTIAELRIVSVAQNSAVSKIHPLQRGAKIGDWAYLSAEDIARIVADRNARAAAKRYAREHV